MQGKYSRVTDRRENILQKYSPQTKTEIQFFSARNWNISDLRCCHSASWERYIRLLHLIYSIGRAHHGHCAVVVHCTPFADLIKKKGRMEYSIYDSTEVSSGDFKSTFQNDPVTTAIVIWDLVFWQVSLFLKNWKWILGDQQVLMMSHTYWDHIARSA